MRNVFTSGVSMGIIQKEYDLWFEQTQDGITDPIQIRETKKAYYSGFISSLITVKKIADTHSMAESAPVLDSIDAEWKSFIRAEGEAHKRGYR